MSKQPPATSALTRLDRNRLRVHNDAGVDVTLFANPEVFLDPDSVRQAQGFVGVQATLDALRAWAHEGLAPAILPADARLERVVLTPDFHKSGKIPVGTVAQTRGFVLPQAVGSDVCCGMRLLVTDARPEELEGREAALMARLRAIYFEGQRALPLSPRQREALLREGLPGLHEARGDNAGRGLWRYYDEAQQGSDLGRVHMGGALETEGVFAFEDWIRASGAQEGYDAQLGSVGGGNHFVELQVVEQVEGAAAARAWGVQAGRVAVMAHSGSVGLGSLVGRHFLDVARGLWPAGRPHPEAGFYPLPTEGPLEELGRRYLSAMGNAAHFAFANRLFLGLMAVRAMSEVLGREVGHRLVYDAPHNLIWRDGEAWVHRKGACPAMGCDLARSPLADDDPARYLGDPVIIPGSMGSASFLMEGRGLDEALSSACHGAGRALPRTEARKARAASWRDDVKHLRVVTPIDPDKAEVRRRPDILAKHHDRLREEAPYAYKDITPVIQTVEDAGIAARCARLSPWMTVKG